MGHRDPSILDWLVGLVTDPERFAGDWEGEINRSPLTPEQKKVLLKRDPRWIKKTIEWELGYHASGGTMHYTAVTVTVTHGIPPPPPPPTDDPDP